MPNEVPKKPKRAKGQIKNEYYDKLNSVFV